MDVKKTYCQNVSKTIIKNLEKRCMEGYYFDDSKAAVEYVMSQFKPGETITWGGSMTLEETGMINAIESSEFSVIERRKNLAKEDQRNEYMQIVGADNFLMSTNAITLDGELINIDGFGNRVSCLIAGPQNVYILAGINKIVTSVEEGISRTRNISTPQNCIRLGLKTPCTVSGRCHDCSAESTICNQIVITRGSRIKGRIKVILIGEYLGY